MGKVTLDASALVALLKEEDGAEVVRPYMPDSSISAVNWSEVLQVLGVMGEDAENLSRNLTQIGLEITAFNHNQASLAADLWESTKRYGLSFADRACIALAIFLGSEDVVTADRAWADLDLPVSVKLVR